MFDPSLVAYLTPGGQIVRLAGATASSGQPLSALTIRADRIESIYTLNLQTEGSSAGYDLDNTRWSVTPAPLGYQKQSLRGATAVVRPAPSTTNTAAVVAYVPLTGGGEVEVPFTLVYGGTAYIADVRKDSVILAGATAKVETGLTVGKAGNYTTRLVRTASPGVPSEKTIIREEARTFDGKNPVLCSETITYPSLPGKGGGYEYYWEVDVDPENGYSARTRQLPMWVLGTGDECKPQSLTTAPTLVKSDFPAIYTRKASDSGQVTPASGKTYQDHVSRWIYWYKANNLGTPVGGAWMSFNSYFANIYYVDMADVESGKVPKYRIEHWDVWAWGYTLAGWYGDDPSASPYPRSKVAVDVPIPDNARPSNGTDRSIAVVGLRNGKPEKIWELWLAQKLASGKWEASSIGVTNFAQDWRHSKSYTVAAAGISALAYALRVSEAKAAVEYVKAERAAGRVPDEAHIVELVPHTLSFNIPKPYSGGYSYPATHTDGTDSDPTTPMEGQLIYLKSTFDVAAQNYPPLTHVIAVVLKHRGAYVTDQTGYSTSFIVEGDFSYGGNIWSTIRESNESWTLKFPDSEWVVGKCYKSRAEWDADTR